MEDQNDSKLPKKPAALDVVYAAIKGGVSGIPIPVIPGVAAEIIGLVLAPPLAKRRDAWFESLGERLKAVEARLELLGENQAFVTTALQATQIAVRTHQEEKLDALRNAVVNSATNPGPEDDVRSMFLTLVDGFTPTHLRILKYFQDRNSLGERTVQRMIREETALTNLMVEELARDGLLRDQRPYAARGRDTGESLLTFGWTLSPLGSQFLQFISRRTR